MLIGLFKVAGGGRESEVDIGEEEDSEKVPLERLSACYLVT